MPQRNATGKKPEQFYSKTKVPTSPTGPGERPGVLGQQPRATEPSSRVRGRGANKPQSRPCRRCGLSTGLLGPNPQGQLAWRWCTPRATRPKDRGTGPRGQSRTGTRGAGKGPLHGALRPRTPSPLCSQGAGPHPRAATCPLISCILPLQGFHADRKMG